MLRTIIITQEELLQNPKEREARHLLAERLQQCAIRYAEDVTDLLNGQHHERIKKMMRQISEAASQSASP